MKSARGAMSLTNGRLTGAGASLLTSRAAAARFTLIGEDHGIETIAEISAALVRDLRPKGYGVLAIEVDPYTARTLETLLRSTDRNALKDFLAKPGRPFPVPFYNWTAEVEYLRAGLANNPRQPTLWGLDQVFIGAVYDQLSDIAARTSSIAAKEMAEKLALGAKDNLEFLGKVTDSQLQDLRSALQGPSDAALAVQVDDLMTSARIYRPFTGGDGSVYLANLARENLMKLTFLKQYRQRQSEEGQDVRVVFKFGANHMQKGLSLTNVPALGSFLADLALQDGAESYHIAILPGPGAIQAAGLSGPQKADAEFEKNFAAFKPHLEAKGFTVFDMAPFKDRPGRWKHLPEDARKLIWSFDAIVFVPNGKPARAIN